MESNTIVDKQSVIYQYLTAFVANLLTIAFGMTEGWTSPSILLLTSGESTLPSGKLTMDQASWIAAFLPLGCTFGNIFFCFAINKFGRKISLLSITIPNIISCFLIIYAENAYYLYAARVVVGFSGGGGYMIVPIFLSEIANDRIRGTIVTSLVLAENFGMVTSYIIGTFCDFYVAPKVMIVLTVIFGVLLLFFPESPTFLVKQNKLTEAAKSIRFYRNLGMDGNDNKLIENELDKLKSAVCDGEKQSKENSFAWSDLKAKTVRKAMVIGLVLVALNQFSGVATMLNYTATIFEESGSNLTPNVSTIVVGVILFFSSLIATNLVDVAGRKILFAISNFGTALGLAVLGAYMTLKSNGYPVEAFNWLPILCLSFSIFVAALGILSIPFIVLSEIMPEKVKDFSVSLCMTLLWSFSFIVTKYLPFLTGSLGFDGSMYLFAGVCVACELFIMFCMPETKGKSHQEIMELLR